MGSFTNGKSGYTVNPPFHKLVKCL